MHTIFLAVTTKLYKLWYELLYGILCCRIGNREQLKTFIFMQIIYRLIDLLSENSSKINPELTHLNHVIKKIKNSSLLYNEMTKVQMLFRKFRKLKNEPEKHFTQKMKLKLVDWWLRLT